AWAIMLQPPAPDSELEGGPAHSHRSLARWRTFDGVLMLGFSIGFASVVAFWVAVVAPLQYWTNLICGAPARQAMTSSGAVWIQTATSERADGTKAVNTSIVSGPRNHALPTGARMSALITKPVSLTAAVSAAFLLVVNAVDQSRSIILVLLGLGLLGACGGL